MDTRGLEHFIVQLCESLSRCAAAKRGEFEIRLSCSGRDEAQAYLTPSSTCQFSRTEIATGRFEDFGDATKTDFPDAVRHIFEESKRPFMRRQFPGGKSVLIAVVTERRETGPLIHVTTSRTVTFAQKGKK